MNEEMYGFLLNVLLERIYECLRSDVMLALTIRWHDGYTALP